MSKKKLLRNLEKQGIPKKIINAFEKTNRKKFITTEQEVNAHLDIPIPIGHMQTTSQPYTIAFMLTLLEVENKQKILEIGSGSGYVLELLSKLNPEGKIIGIERIKELADKSQATLQNQKNIKIINKNAMQGLKNNKEVFDRILISAECEKIPQKVVNQLKIKGVMIAPVRGSLIKLKKESGENQILKYPGFSFVPLINTK